MHHAGSTTRAQLPRSVPNPGARKAHERMATMTSDTPSALSRNASPAAETIFRDQTAVPRGFAFGAARCGIKQTRLDLGCILSDVPTVAAGCFTQNKARAASVTRNAGLIPQPTFAASWSTAATPTPSPVSTGSRQQRVGHRLGLRPKRSCADCTHGLDRHHRRAASDRNCRRGRSRAGGDDGRRPTPVRRSDHDDRHLDQARAHRGCLARRSRTRTPTRDCQGIGNGPPQHGDHPRLRVHRCRGGTGIARATPARGD